jgi:polar amino acid transport system substrate-binding protein
MIPKENFSNSLKQEELMKKNLFIAIVMMMVVSMLFAACAPKNAVVDEAIQEPGVVGDEYPAPGGVITIATDATFPPFEMVDESTKELIGFDIELMKAIAAEAGLEYEFVNLPFDPMLAGLSECQYDMAIAAITITEDRQKEFFFSDPYIDAGQIIVVKAGKEGINSKADLSGMIVGAQLGTTGEIEAQSIDNVTYKPYDTYDLAFLDLANDQIDAVIADYPTALGFIAKNPDRLQTVGEKFTDESYGIAFCKNRADLVDLINPALQKVKEQGVITDLAAKYLAGE